MPKYGHLKPGEGIRCFSGWYDTDFIQYKNLPPENELTEIPEEIWNQRHILNHFDGVDFVKRPPPSPEVLKTRLINSAKFALAESNNDLIIYLEEQTPIPDKLKEYRLILKKIIAGEDSRTELPVKPIL